MDLGMRDSLIEKCLEAKKNAYCPYSKFHVGCAVLTKQNKIFTGCNVENASYGLTICAERIAIGKAVSEGCRDFIEIAVCSDSFDDNSGPCGACRQFISEFGMDISIILVNTNDNYKVYSMKEMLPFVFNGKTLQQTSI